MSSQISQPDLFINWRRFADWVSEHSLEILTAFGIGLAIVAALIGLRILVCRLLGGRQATGWAKVIEGIVRRTYLFFIIAAAAKIVTINAVLPRRLDQAIDIIFVMAAALQVAIWTRALIVGAIERRVGDSAGSALGTAMDLIRGLVTAAAFTIAIIVILDNVGVNVTGLIAGLGIGGIAIGLAAQGVFRDLFAALAIIFDRPFRRGDTIQFGGPTGVTGTVEHIGLKTTRLRALDGELVAVGNDKLLQDRIHNFAAQARRRAVMILPLQPSVPADLLARLPGEIAAIVSAQPQATFDRAHVSKLSAAGTEIELVFHMETADFAAYADARQAIILAVIRRFAELGVEWTPPPAPPPPQLGKS
jgi:small-conductance mechanosensitive channel